MKNFIKFSLTIIAFSVLIISPGCSDFLEEEVYSEYDPNKFLQDKAGVDALLTGAYSSMAITDVAHRDYASILSEFPTDIAWETGGGLERLVIPIMQFNWDSNVGFFDTQYNKYYQAIARANNVLLVAQSLKGVNEATITQINAEARFIRGFSYYVLHDLFGPTPIIEIPSGSSLDEIERIGKQTPKATEAQYRAYVEADLTFAAKNLKPSAVSSRANLGSSWALLSKFHLSNREWQKAADAAAEVLKLDYALYTDYTKLFAIEGENNKEYILRFECLPGPTSPQSNLYMAHAFPPSYPILSTWTNFGAQFRTFTAFYEKFDLVDLRRKLFIDEYTQIGATTVTKLSRDASGKALDNVRSFKFLPDPGGIGDRHGNDIPYIRLADIILSRAEALNELNGPNQESIDLINRIRNRAKVNPVNLGTFISKESLRDFILDERGKEFFSEGKRREDLIRHNKFIQQAIDRGIQAKPHQVLYPLPKAQIDNNPNLKQNDGYTK
ncbi:RagB/SusD family nutrient uptake outer membrane protein [Daejeonella sp.]|uniref:RagB/SusD family nutrient uptake outer membrane protein n=1 Tax=Daejeonella sp. TaxID=2805397 RepID=UPI0025B7C95F|nr:RagB/SusD family nutrient uptake outer membrane protein [Daejeonella sp.]